MVRLSKRRIDQKRAELERERREIEERRREVIKSIMPGRHYDMLEVVIEYWNKNVRGINKRALGEELRGKEGMVYPQVKADVEQDIQYLHTRGYIFSDKSGDCIVPNHRGTTVYRRVHPNALISANCRFRD